MRLQCYDRNAVCGMLLSEAHAWVSLKGRTRIGEAKKSPTGSEGLTILLMNVEKKFVHEKNQAQSQSSQNGKSGDGIIQARKIFHPLRKKLDAPEAPSQIRPLEPL